MYGKNQASPVQLCGSDLTSCKEKHQSFAIISSEFTSSKDDSNVLMIHIISAYTNAASCYHRHLEIGSLDAFHELIMDPKKGEGLCLKI